MPRPLPPPQLDLVLDHAEWALRAGPDPDIQILHQAALAPSNGVSRPGSKRDQPIDLTEDSSSLPTSKMGTVVEPKASGRKRKATHLSPEKRKATDSSSSEKRLRRHRTAPPESFYDVYNRALSQRFYVLGRSQTGTSELPEERIEMTGSTGNIYNVVIGQVLSCNCPHALKGNQCKHVIYAMKTVLNAPFDLVYQAALTSSELRTIFAAAPIADVQDKAAESNKRKPIEGDCPICFTEFEAASPESIVWCRAACGQNMHEECFRMWARAKAGNITCPFCRSTWEGGEEGAVTRVRRSEGDVSEGYVNVADQLGINRERDESTYSRWYFHPEWRRGRGRGRTRGRAR